MKKLHLFDALAAVLLAVAAAWLLWRIDVQIGYDWDWSQIPRLFWRDGEPGLIAKGFFTTIRLAIVASLLAAPIGLAIALLRIAADPFARLCGWGYVALIRNTPPLVFLFVFYFFLTRQLITPLGLDAFAREADGATRVLLEFLVGDLRQIETFAVGALCLAMFEAAYIAEILRAGLLSVPKGQNEAARALGLSETDRLRYVTLPIAIKNAAPPLANQFVSLIKDSSLLSVIAIQDLTFLANQAALTTRKHFEIWLTIAVLYFTLCYGCSLIFKRLEPEPERR